jgi:uncharacterized lipoprotein
MKKLAIALLLAAGLAGCSSSPEPSTPPAESSATSGAKDDASAPKNDAATDPGDGGCGPAG